MDCDYTKRSYLLPAGCKDLIDVLKLKQKSFFDTHRKLIYESALKAGLTDGEAQEVVQEVIICVEKLVPKLIYDPPKGSFKGWLLHLTRWLVADKLRKRRDNDSK